MESMGKKPRRRRSFTPEFKAEIVELRTLAGARGALAARGYPLSAGHTFRGTQPGRGGQMERAFDRVFGPLGLYPRGSGPTIAVRSTVKVNAPGIEK
jgi:hypothetical protein